MNIFPGYEILEVLPRGGMSTVYRARQLSLDRIVAIKSLPPAMGADPVDVEKFMAEAKITAGLKHPNIVQVYDFGKSEEGVYYFVMEYISGYSVAAWIRRKQNLSEENSLLCALSIAAAMNYAWQKAGIVHCDIKPDNVIIDGDGTVKIADLGLARSVKSILGRARADEGLIVGTPNYISPEQSRGDEPLDCRADIYSLGAMLYHCMTGVMPFEKLPANEVMDRQISDFISDPQDVNPRVSVWSACLIEKMMAKDRNFRPKDWSETIKDISNARSEMMPQGSLPPGVASTVKRSAMRELRLQEASQLPARERENDLHLFHSPGGSSAAKKRSSSRLLLKMTIAAAAVVVILAGGWAGFNFLVKEAGENLKRERDKDADKGPQPEVAVRTVSETHGVHPDHERAAQEKFEQTARWFKANPTSYNDAILRYRKLTNEVAGTKYADLALNEAQKLERTVREIKATVAKLDQKADSQADKGRFLEAAAVYEKYQGPFEKETAGERKRKVQALHVKHVNHQKEEQDRVGKLAELQLKHAADEIAMILLDDDVKAALGRISVLASDLPVISTKPEFKNMTATLEKSAGAEQKIIDSFRLQKDQEISVTFLQGPQKLMIRDVQGDFVVAEKVLTIEQGTIGVQKNFRARDLALSEKISRIGNVEGPEFALMQTLLAVRERDYQKAAATAVKTDPFLSVALIEAIGWRSKDVCEWRAVQAMTHILHRAGIYSDENMPDPGACLDALRGKKYAYKSGPAMSRAVGQFRGRYGSTEIAARYDRVLEALTNADASSRDDMPPALTSFKPEEQLKSARPMIESITMKMMELNAGLREDEIVFQMDDSGQVVKAEIVSMYLRDIKALENMTDLQNLVCAGMRPNIWSGMPVIAPLSDLSPLKKMNLRELVVNHTKIRDISILSQMPLVGLNLAHTKVNDLQPLKGMQLRYLDVSFTSVRDLRSLAGIPLAHLNINGTEIYDLSPLSGMPLKMLSAGLTKVRDLSPLRSMPLRHLSVRSTAVTDIAFLSGLPLEYLDLADTDVRDISALKGMGLRELDLHNTRVKDLSALEQMPLESLKINGSGVRDISPLKKMPLKALDLRGVSIVDLTPIEDSFIEEIWLDDFYAQANSEKTRAIMAVLHRMPKLKIVNGRPLRAWTAREE